MVFPGGRTLTQLPTAHTRGRRSAIDDGDPAISNDPPSGLDDPDPFPSPLVLPVDGDHVPPKNYKERYARKKLNQWARWKNVTVPELINLCMDYLAATANLRLDTPLPLVCTCRGASKDMQITAVYTDHLEYLNLTTCSCISAAQRLMSIGLFPSAPQVPSLAFDLNMLELVSTLFLHTAPNVTAWATTLETFLGIRAYKLTTRDSIRRRFGNALRWYNYLVDCVSKKIDQTLEVSRQEALKQREDEHTADLPHISFEDKCPSKETASGPINSNGSHVDESTRPSSYLRSRCILCFAGRDGHDSSMPVDVVVCLDACFSQKRWIPSTRRAERGERRDPVKMHPSSVFLSEEEVQTSSKSTSLTSSPSKRKNREFAEPESAIDECEGPLRVPNSVLDGCESSFKAADEEREKASTQFFDDTGLMALMCRHDRVLWLANMSTPGERQHYPLALLKKLFQNLPVTWTVGVLYDIGCQLHRSCYKWGFLPEYRERIRFGISVFHAYGHQWPCQVIYHPRKCVGFGFTDGESCERFWSLIAHLVAVLRVCGYHQRLYILDSQIHHLDSVHRLSLADWLAKKFTTCQERLAAAQEELTRCNVGIEALRCEWDAQQASQTKPLERTSMNAADKDIDHILNLEQIIRILEKQMKQLETSILAGESTDETRMQLTEVEDRLARTQLSAKKYRAKLDIQTRSKVDRLRGNQYLNNRVNALALKTRIRDRLRQRKFEFSRVDRVSRTHASQSSRKYSLMRTLGAHATNAIQQREPGIQALARRYNTLCIEMSDLIKRGAAPPGAQAPTPIDVKSLWNLDVDDPIWHDTGLMDEDLGEEAYPRWFADDAVRKGIRAMLEIDRCNEELARLRKERTTLQEWLQDEWAATADAIARHAREPGLRNQLQLRQDKLLRLAVTWRRRVGDFKGVRDWDSSWGP
ncbi:hypothetical protein PUNSTDRAFT_60254, partial [Punctularia strigosozonata HHB-11173 SS5]|uniref:uncharacterized protein n=1 Tax=Punctularia strigosozonata (strain HHB-11173) TaxID=741275 RepID=UPI0004416E60